MRAAPALLLCLLAILPLLVESCDPDHSQTGCKIYSGGCVCGYGCKTEFIYRTRRRCLDAVRERSSNVCYRMPCVTGTCIQTAQDPGFSCKCEGTGFYGQRCEKVLVESCDPDHSQTGCKIYSGGCVCGYGCKTEFIYRTRRRCLDAVRERSSNVCYRMPCVTGTCIQTAQDPGFSCKCEGTGFYGQRCEKACPAIPMRGLVFPHECIVI